MPDRTTPVVVGVDGTEAGIDAARWAAAVADHVGAPLTIIHAMRDVDAVLFDVISADTDPDEPPSRKHGQAILQRAVEGARADHPDLSINRTLTGTSVREALTKASRRARLVVLGCDDVSRSDALLVGSTTLALVALSSCPVVAWRGGATAPTSQPVVVGVDGAHSDAALAAAFEFADQFNLGVIAVHGWSARRRAADAIEKEQCDELEATIAPWRERYPRVAVTTVVEQFKPRRALLASAAHAQLMVIGNRGRGNVASSLLGSTTLNMLHHCRVPVMVCHPQDSQSERSVRMEPSNWSNPA